MYKRFIIMIFCLIILFSCGKNDPVIKSGETQQEQSNNTIVCVMGGLGASQMTYIASRINLECPEVELVSFGDWDAYKGDIEGFLNNNPHKHCILIGHSFGCSTILNETKDVKFIDAICLIDPVATSGNHLYIQPNVAETEIWYRGNLLGPVTAKVDGQNITTYTEYNLGHNDVPNSKNVCDMIINKIKEIE